MPLPQKEDYYMILNALDEVLFWDDIDTLKSITKHLNEKYYPQDYEGYHKEYDLFFKSVIPDKTEFIRRLEHYAEVGKPIWISGRNDMCDDIDADLMVKAISVRSKIDNGEQMAKRSLSYQDNKPSFWDFYTHNILHQQDNRILELTVGACGGTNAVMRKMTDRDYYMGVDIDFACAKNADALAKYYNVNGLGITGSLWNLPFDDCMFTSVCSNQGLEECREIPTILEEAYRVLQPGGKIVLHCANIDKMQAYERFKQYDFSVDEMIYWAKRIRMYPSTDGVEELLNNVGFKFCNRMFDERLGSILVYEKQV
ncbi:MAG: class I SAM-dependent methyltransferase [Clostridia bacterium]|nr:class I SAM-dependent methyltransferase [Clostridia bacterium]